MYYRQETSRTQVETQNPDIEVLAQLIDLLRDEQLLEEVRRGNVTLAMVRPGLETATTLEGSDNEVAETIEKHIEGLGTIAKFAVTFDMDAINRFYAEPKEGMLKKDPRVKVDYPSQWEEFSEVMTSGPTTILLLHTPNGNAISGWRRQVGHWDIERNRDPDTLRGRFGIQNYNNLLHGSDSPEAVIRELGIIADCLERAAPSRDEGVSRSSPLVA